MIMRIVRAIFVTGVFVSVWLGGTWIASFAQEALQHSEYLPVVSRCTTPQIKITHLPTYGSSENLRGSVDCVLPGQVRLVVALRIDGTYWWSKPTFAAPLTLIEADGSWECDVTSGGSDHLADAYALFLVPATYTPPLLSGSTTLPPELIDASITHLIIEREPVLRTIEFAGYTWRVKASEEPIDPGPVRYSDRPEDVSVDPDGRLHMRIVAHNGVWYGSEVVNTQSLGYGVYSFAIDSDLTGLDPNVVLGMFTYDTGPDANHRELDIEVSKWGVVNNDNLQFVVQPYTHSGNILRFALTHQDTTVHRLTWAADQVDFAIYAGEATGQPLKQWTYQGPDVPQPGAESARINLWLFGGQPPSDGKTLEVVFADFTFAPLPAPCLPSLEFTRIPTFNSNEDLRGKVACVDPGAYKVAVYLEVDGKWYTKPYYDEPLTTIQGDSTWKCDVTTGGDDRSATSYAAFLVPNGYNPPDVTGFTTLPPELYTNSVANAVVERTP